MLPWRTVPVSPRAMSSASSSSSASSRSTSLASTPSTSRSPSPAPPHSTRFHVAPTPCGFLGAFASTALERGSLVLSEAPLFTLDAPLQAYLFQRSQHGSGPTPVDGEDDRPMASTLDEFLDRAILASLELKSEGARAAFYDLANTHPELPPALGIFTTNAVSTTGETGGLFLELSRFNSACRPNLSRPVFAHGQVTVHALRDIDEGEELVWQYLGVPFEFESIEARRTEMQRVFGFVCACDACEAWGKSASAQADSERRLLRLRHLKEKGMNEWSIVQVNRLAREEGLWEVAERLASLTSAAQRAG